MEIEQILSELKFYDGKYKKDAIDAAVKKQKEITPYLIEILEDVYNDIDKYLDFSLKYYHHIYALILLTKFEEHKSHDIITKILSIPNIDIADVFGGFIIDDATIVLIDTCNNNVDKIIELALNRNAHEYARTCAFRALRFAYAKGIISREHIIDIFKSILISEEDEVICGSLAVELYYLRPEELMTEIKSAYNLDIIPRGFIAETDFDDILKKPQEKVLADLKKRYEQEKITDVHKKMSWWACFNKPKKAISTQDNDYYSDKLKSDAKKKSKRKLAKASKKANRKKK